MAELAWLITVGFRKPERGLTEARLRKALNRTMEVAGETVRVFPDFIPDDCELSEEERIAFGFSKMKGGLAWDTSIPGVIDAEFQLRAEESSPMSNVAVRALSVFVNALHAIPELSGPEVEAIEVETLYVSKGS